MRKILTILIAIQFFTMGSVNADMSSTPYSWGFKKGHDGQQADAGATYDAIVKKHQAIYKGAADKKVLYLTFDNGYENGYTTPILDVLKKHKVPAAFFLTGHYLESAPDLVKRMVTEGHIIGNHSWNHIDFTKSSPEKIATELERLQLETKNLTGQKVMRYVRPPSGTFSEKSLEITNKLGYKTVFWSVAIVDWKTDAQHGWKYAYDNIMKQIHPGAIIMLHAVSKDNAEALNLVITHLKEQGYQFKSLDDFNA